MSAIMEKELNTVYGGNGSAGTMLGGPKFNVGDRVMAKSAPEGGVGTVVKSQYNEGWWYSVRLQGGILYTSEDDLVPALM